MYELSQSVALEIYNLGCVKFGNFRIKCGKRTNVYVDLRLIASRPNILTKVGHAMLEVLSHNNINYDVVCGVPYGGIPIATFVSIEANKSMVIKRKEYKSYGTKQMVEGIIDPKENRCLIIEDVISTGESVLQTIIDLEIAGLVVKDVCVILARDPVGVNYLKQKGYNVHSLFNLPQLVDILSKSNMLSTEEISLINNEIASQAVDPETVFNKQRDKMSYKERINYCFSAVAKKLLLLMDEKSTNLCVAADSPSINDIKKFARMVGPYICILKIHTTIINDYTESDIKELQNIADEFKFMILEDRKLSDIGNTVSLQFAQISKWTNVVTAHSVSGFGVLVGISAANNHSSEPPGVFLVAEMSCSNNLITDDYTEKTVKMAEMYNDVVIGVVCQKNICSSPGLIQLTPGVSLNNSGDNLGQQYNTPEEVVNVNCADIAVVGRSIISAENPIEMAKIYREKLWNAYLKRIYS